MTNEEALTSLNLMRSSYSELDIKRIRLACNIAMKAISKQIPKKATVDPANLCDFQNFHCPTCNKKIVSRLDGVWIAGKLQDYCDDCGQALDWRNFNKE